MAFFTRSLANHSAYSNPGAQVRALIEQGFRRCFADELNQRI